MAEVDFYPVPIVFFFFFVFNLSLSQESLAAGASTIQSEVASPWARANAKGPGSLIPVTPASPSQDPSTSPPIFSLPTSIPSHFGIIKTKLTFYAYFFNTTMDDDTLKAMEEFLLEFINLSFKEGLSAAKLKSFEVLTQIRTRNILEIKTMVTAYPIFKEMLISEANLKNTLILHITSTTFLHEIQKKIPFFKKTHIFSRDLKQIQTAFPSLVPTQPFMIFDENTRRNSTSNNHIIDSNITNIEKIVCIVMGCSIILFVAAGICVCKRCCQQKCSHIGGYGAFSFKELGSMQEGPSVDGMVNRTPLSLDPFERMTKKKKSAPEMTEKTFSISHLLRRKDSAIASEEQKVAPTKTLDNNTSGREMRHGMSSWGGHFDAWVRRASVSKTGKFIPETVFKKDIDWKEKAGKEGHTEMTSPPISKLSNDMCVNGSRSEILGDDWNPQSDFICMFGAQQKVTPKNGLSVDDNINEIKNVIQNIFSTAAKNKFEHKGIFREELQRNPKEKSRYKSVERQQLPTVPKPPRCRDNATSSVSITTAASKDSKSRVRWDPDDSTTSDCASRGSGSALESVMSNQSHISRASLTSRVRASSSTDAELPTLLLGRDHQRTKSDGLTVCGYQYTFHVSSSGTLGIIIEGSRNKQPTILSVKEFSLLRGKVESGDRIVMVGDVSTINMSAQDVTTKLKKEKRAALIQNKNLRITVQSDKEKKGFRDENSNRKNQKDSSLQQS